MKRKILFLFVWLVLFGGLFFACNRKSFTQEEQELRELVYHHPDSALRLLELAIDSPEVLKVPKERWSYYHSQAKKLADMVTAEFGITDILIDYVGPVIGAHSGPGTLALFFYGKER